MKNLILLTTILIFACSNSNDPQALRKKIETLEKDKRKIDQEIRKIKKNLEVIEDQGEKKKESYPLVVLKKIKKGKFEHFVEVNGYVEAKEHVKISPEMSGQIKNILVVKGQSVKKGDIIAELNVEQLNNNILELEASYEFAKKVFEKQQRLWEKNIGSEIQFLEAKNNKETLDARLMSIKATKDFSILKSSIDGIVDDIYMNSGEMAAPGMPLAEIVNLNKVCIIADVSEKYISKVSRGDQVKLSFPSLGIEPINARLNRISNVIKRKNRTFEIEATVNNPFKKLKPNLIAIVEFKDYEQEEALFVPNDVIRKDMKGSFVFVIDEKEGEANSVIKSYIVTGMADNLRTIVIAGITENDRIVIKGQNNLANGDKVEISN